jgi:hypothetical protein
MYRSETAQAEPTGPGIYSAKHASIDLAPETSLICDDENDTLSSRHFVEEFSHFRASAESVHARRMNHCALKENSGCRGS